jgi:hypothetical protein
MQVGCSACDTGFPPLPPSNQRTQLTSTRTSARGYAADAATGNCPVPRAYVWLVRQMGLLCAPALVGRLQLRRGPSHRVRIGFQIAGIFIAVGLGRSR